ncbi:MAG: bifunctional D-glycero-beta-D-manno-heptose-7-phosphate kinase/D-glycero-beta-D-manno-heptose 1-phosphate adenylyltransferase HldE [Desulfobacterales bacterium]|jgi:D-beta-D-heptose 7-phosphate kinase/D-beta-D-heptose 1-phosphate adenosyltransferase|nr:bifunctional D-glycero-beta-D-manno-heptose-7-phosphate kinase/D-glycero-beta-D-manno-heptose 1-phosphate adenylyltransferase HldE [Desulfobacterales bacterium]
MPLSTVLPDFQKHRILVVGDLMLDRYLWGEVRRISPEAPVPVFQVKKHSEVRGGGGNVASNLIGLGAAVSVVGLRGADEAGRRLKGLLHHDRIRDLSIECPDRPTITKTRLVSNGQQLIRLDEEEIRAAGAEVVQEAIRRVEAHAAAADAIILSDYGKGFLQSAGMSQAVIAVGRRRGIPVFVDPKGRDWERYRGATCITPNSREMEAYDGAAFATDEALSAAMGRTIDQLDLARLLVTRGAAGMCLMGRGLAPEFIATQARQVFDVSGAGDTVIAALALAVAAGMAFPDAARLANLAAGVVVGKVGTQPINLFELTSALKTAEAAVNGHFQTKLFSRETALVQVDAWRANGEKIIFTNGCFDLLHPGHIHLLNKAKDFGGRLVVGLNADSSVRRLKGPSRPILTEQDRACILGSLDCVDMVVLFEEDTPENLIAMLTPDILAKGSDYSIRQVVGREMVESYGGAVRLIEVLQGYSTTALSRKIQRCRRSELPRLHVMG